MGIEVRSFNIMKSAVFFDIDGTLWNYDHYIPDSTKRAIKELRANGNLALLCSGRTRAFIQNKDLLSLGWDGIVCACGCHVELNDKIEYQSLFDNAEAIAMVEMVRSYGFKPILEGPVNLYMDDDEFPVGDLYGDLVRADLGDNLKTICGDNYGNWVINKISCATEVDEDKKQECLKRINQNYFAIEHADPVVEIIPKNTSKATGMLKACELLGVDPANTYAFGDSANDLEMLEEAAVGIAMGNGTDSAKEAADYVTDAFDEDGIYNGLKHFGLI